jgi:DNA replication protein DnaC
VSLDDAALRQAQEAARKRMGLGPCKPAGPALLPTDAACSRCKKPIPGTPMPAGRLRDAVLAVSKRIVCSACRKLVEEEGRQRLREAAAALVEAVKADPAGTLKRCGVEERWQEARFESCPDLPKDLLKIVWNWAKSPDDVLFLYGIQGCGKTWVAAATMLEVMRRGVLRPVECLYLRERTFQLGLKRSYSDPHESTVQRGEHVAARIPLLLYDDLGSELGNDKAGWKRGELAGLFADRHARCLPTIITSNLDVPSVGELVDPRLASRLRESATAPVKFPDVDLRMKRTT